MAKEKISKPWDQVFKFHITLNNTTPVVWRRVLVPTIFTLEKLHSVFQFVMMARIKKGPTPEEILAALPEKLLKKESQKALKNVYEGEGYSHPLSEAMENSPRRLLKEDAMRGV